MTSEVREQHRLDAEIRDVLRKDACTGCGACPLLDTGLHMVENADGYLRPLRQSDGDTRPGAAAIFRDVCPGVTVSANATPEARHHPTMGAYLAVWEAWATDSVIRHRGSSGGVLTALNAWLLESGKASRVVGAAAASDPRRSVAVTMTTRDEALRAAGSRYTPVGVLSGTDVLLPGTAIVGKPCEASAVSALAASRVFDGASEPPLVLSFFCAGTPSARATDKLLGELGVPADAVVDDLWYRGRGWPGQFTARSGDTVVKADYEDSWGKALGPATQWRCKVCPDGVGESADIVAADYWQVDERGYPSFVEGDGASALIARTSRGLEIVLEAAAAGVIHISEIGMGSLDAVQPLQRERRRFLAARMLGSRLAGRGVPRYRGFGLWRLSLSQPRVAWRTLRGTFSRIRRSRIRA